MAPAATPARKKRENNYFEVGVQGRKTGVTIPDKGIRDEHGMEPLDGIFSSPEKSSPVKRSSGPKSRGTVTTSESMDIQESSIPDPTETLHAGQLMRNSRTMLPPPMARSPIKTALGSSPRRHSSVAPKSRPRPSTSSPERATSESAVRRIDFSADSSDLRATPRTLNSSGPRRGKNRRSVYDIEESPVRGSITEETIIEEETLPNGDSEVQIMQIAEDSLVAGVGDDTEETGADETGMGISVEDTAISEPPSQRMTRGRKRKSDMADASEISEQPSAKRKASGGVRTGAGRPSKQSKSSSSKTSASQGASKPRAKPGPKPKAKKQAPPPPVEESLSEEDVAEDIDMPVEEEATPVPAKPRGRQAANKAKAQAQKAKPSTSKDEGIFKVPQKKTKGTKTKPVTTQSVSNAQKGALPDPSVETYVDPTGKPKDPLEIGSMKSEASRFTRSSSLLVQRSENDSSFKTTQRGRRTFGRINWWEGEKVEYHNDLTAKDVIRAISVEPTSKPKRRRGPAKHLSTVEEDDEDEFEDWEVEPGTLAGTVSGWDSRAQVTTEEEVETELAWSKSGVTPRDVPNAEFRYAKIVGQEFFGCGIVELPPGGIKRSKNSRRMQMAFFVSTGVVEVEVGDARFTIHKGGVFQVPRGNFYSIDNKAKTTSRLFFAQGCEKVVDED